MISAASGAAISASPLSPLDYLGFDIFFRVAGSGPPLLLIHGYPFNSYDWAPIWPRWDRTHSIASGMIGRLSKKVRDPR